MKHPRGDILPTKNKSNTSKKSPNVNYDKHEIERLFFQMDNLLHARVNSLLVAEGIFFVAAASVWKDLILLLALFIVGAVTTILFTWTNLKLYWRSTWLIEQMKTHSKFYDDYLAMRDIKRKPGRWGKITLWLFQFVITKNQPRWLDTGYLYTWGLLIVFLFGWVAILTVSAYYNFMGIISWLIGIEW